MEGGGRKVRAAREMDEEPGRLASRVWESLNAKVDVMDFTCKLLVTLTLRLGIRIN